MCPSGPRGAPGAPIRAQTQGRDGQGLRGRHGPAPPSSFPPHHASVEARSGACCLHPHPSLFRRKKRLPFEKISGSPGSTTTVLGSIVCTGSLPSQKIASWQAAKHMLSDHHQTRQRMATGFCITPNSLLRHKSVRSPGRRSRRAAPSGPANWSWTSTAFEGVFPGDPIPRSVDCRSVWPNNGVAVATLRSLEESRRF
jgi:hypothetical protein